MREAQGPWVPTEGDLNWMTFYSTPAYNSVDENTSVLLSPKFLWVHWVQLSSTPLGLSRSCSHAGAVCPQCYFLRMSGVSPGMGNQLEAGLYLPQMSK